MKLLYEAMFPMASVDRRNSVSVHKGRFKTKAERERRTNKKKLADIRKSSSRDK